MSFLNELKKQKQKLKETQTVVTNVDGQRFLERGSERQNVDPSAYGFVVDTKPDDIPVLVTEFLYIGSQDCTSSIVLEKYNIKNVLSLGINVDISNVKHKFVECLDLPETNIRIALAECLPFVRKCIECKENVLIHCNAGVSRTAMVAIAYFMHYEKIPFENAYSLVKEKRPAIYPNVGFRSQLKALVPGEVI